jgi:predicted permease
VLSILSLTAPLFLLVALGYALARFGGWKGAIADALARFVFAVAIPALLFQLMSDFSRLPRVDPWLLAAYFGGTFVVYALAMAVGRAAFSQDGATAAVFGMGGVFGNTVLLGIPLAQVSLGAQALPAISMVIVFHSLVMWTLITVTVEWARHRAPTLTSLWRTARGVAMNPIVAGILLGVAFGYTGLALPGVVDRTIALLGDAAAPLSLIALGMSLQAFGVREGWRESLAMSAFKLACAPLAVYGLARALALSPVETQAITVLAALPVGANVYLMARAFGALAGPVSSSIVLTTALSAVTTPIVIALTR